MVYKDTLKGFNQVHVIFWHISELWVYECQGTVPLTYITGAQSTPNLVAARSRICVVIAR